MESFPATSSVSPSAAVPPKPAWYSWRRLGLNFLTLSVLAHLIFGVLATYFVVQTVQAKHKQNFAGAPQSHAAEHAVEHKVQMQKQRQTMSAPASLKRVVTTANSRVSLPDMPSMPSMNTAVAPMTMAGMSGGMGLGTGSSGGGGNSGGQGGAGLSLFGLRGSTAGLEGTFYDYKMDQGYQPIKGMDSGAFAHVVHDVLPSGTWHPDQPYKHFTSFAKLHGRYFIYPAIQDTQAGSAFQSPRSGPGCWLAVYRGSFTLPTGGSFRFVGFGDNVMVVKVGGHIVLDASDHGYTGIRREASGNIKFPGKDQTPLFTGEWVTLDAGESKDIEIAVGDEGGIFCSGLFVQPKGVSYAQGDNGIPKLPIFMLGTLTEADRQLLGKSLPAECLQGLVFQAQAPRPSTDIFSH